MARTTQDVTRVENVRDGIVIKKDGTLCAIILVSSVNFALKSEDEKYAILSHFEGFLNSLETSIQISIQSRKFNEKPYLRNISELLKAQTNDLLIIQTREYISFIENFVKNTNIISKSFFIIVSYAPFNVSTGEGSFVSSFFSSTKKEDHKKELSFVENQTQLAQRVSFIQKSLSSMGLRGALLPSEEVVEVLYKSFNPGDTQPIPDIIK